MDELQTAGPEPGRAADETRREETETERRVVIKARPFNAEAPLEALGAAVTPEDAFYVRNNFEVPDVDVGTHRLAVDGAVEAPCSLSMPELAALPRRTVTVTLECAGNNRLGFSPLPAGEPWQRGAVSTGEFSGVPLREVLARARLRPGVVELLAEGADAGAVKGADTPVSFARSLPLEVALREDTLLALALNGEPLTLNHGAPVRLVVPGWYAMASVKWVRRLSALTAPFHGHFQTERYVYDGHGGPKEPVRWMRVKALLVSPAEGTALSAGEPVELRGQAWSGRAPVVKVEVSVDGVDAWQEARLLGEPAAGRWSAFTLTLPPLEPGRHTLRCRATDALGETQPDAPPWNRLGYGNNAVQAVVVRVVEE